MIVLGITGTIGSGKGVVSDYLHKKHGFKVFNMGDIARDLARKEGKKGTRKNLQNIYVKYKSKFSKNYFIKKMVEKVKSSGFERVIIDGVRGPWDYDVPKKEFGKEFRLIKVDAEPELRFKRMKKRRRVGFPKTIEKFREEEKREYSIFKMEKTFEKADFIFDNSSSVEELHKQIDKFITTLITTLK